MDNHADLFVLGRVLHELLPVFLYHLLQLLQLRTLPLLTLPALLLLLIAGVLDGGGLVAVGHGVGQIDGLLDTFLLHL